MLVLDIILRKPITIILQCHSSCMYINSIMSHSLVPRRLRRGRRNAWYTLFAHALISKPISKNLWAIGYSGNLPCNNDVTSLKSLLPQVAFFIMASTTFRSEVQPSPMQSPTLSNSCKCLMSVFNPSSEPYMTDTMFSCGSFWLR